MKNNKGITLIALVVTIIVLLILAGVSIAMLTGENGILGRASESSWKSQLGGAEDTVNVYVANYLTDYYAVTYTSATSQFGVTYNDASDAVKKGCEEAQKDLGTGFTVVYTAAKAADATAGTEASDGTIVITYTKGTAHTVTGTLKGSVTTWGAMK